jgi:hypothetical protein
MKNYTLLAAFTVFSSLTYITSSAQHQLVKKWETDTVLHEPESVYYDAANKVLYVSNIDGKGDEKDGKGSIGKVGLDGKVINNDWVTGLNAPKGLTLTKNTLWVADVDEVVGVDIKSGKITQHIKIDGAKFLNDMTSDKKGTLYVSDSQGKTVYMIQNGKPSLYLQDLQGPNGLLVYNNSLYVLDRGTLYKAGKDKKLEKIAEGMEASTDGIENVQGNEFIVSCWSGVIYYVKADGTTEQLIDTREQKINSADIGYDAKNKIVYVPTFFKNNIVAYQLQ